MLEEKRRKGKGSDGIWKEEFLGVGFCLGSMDLLLRFNSSTIIQ